MQIGKTKVFLRAGQMAELDARRAEVLNNAAKTIQGCVQTHYARKRFIALRKATVLVQSLWRGDSLENLIAEPGLEMHFFVLDISINFFLNSMCTFCFLFYCKHFLP